MRTFISGLMFFACCFSTFGSDARWEYVAIVNGEVGDVGIHLYCLYGYVVSDNGGASTEGPLLGYATQDGFYLKQYDYRLAPMEERDNNVWVLAFYGDLLSHETIEQMARVELTDWNDYSKSGGVLVPNPSDFYLGFMSTGDNAYDGIDRFGWYHVSVDDNLEMTLLDSGIGLYGESVVVGVGPTPEPSSAMLLLFGLAALGLRRKPDEGGKMIRELFDPLKNRMNGGRK